jgi:hypothetical protein
MLNSGGQSFITYSLLTDPRGDAVAILGFFPGGTE